MLFAITFIIDNFDAIDRERGGYIDLLPTKHDIDGLREAIENIKEL